MRRKLFTIGVLTLASGYAVKRFFTGMNLASDLYYVGGVVGLLLWFLLILPLLYKLLMLRGKKNAHAQPASGSSGNGT